MAKQNKNKLVSIDTVEERPRWGASKHEAKLHEQLRARANRIHELELKLAAVARGNDGGISMTIRLTDRQHEQLGLLARSGLYAQSIESTAAELLALALREPMHRDNAESQRWHERVPMRRYRKARRPRRRPGKR